MVAAAINLIVDISTIRWIGLYAASGSTLVSYIALFLYRVVNVRNYITLAYDVKHMIFTFAVLAVQIYLYYMHSLTVTIVNMTFGAVFFILLNKRNLALILRKLASKIKKKK